jgi:drug/metabolite transporter (DMT)-like permease
VRNPEIAPGSAKSADTGARLMLVVLCLIWGTTWPVIKIALTEIEPFSMRTCTYALGALTLFLVCLVKRRSFRVPNLQAWTHVFVASMLNIVAFPLLTSFGQLATTTSRVSILAYTMPIWSVVMAWLFLGERLTKMQTIALGLCAAGLAVLIYPLTANGLPLGVVLTVVAAVSWAAGTVYLKWAHIEADPMGVATWQLVIAFAAIATFTYLYRGGFDYGTAHTKALLAMAFSGVMGSGVAYGLWFAIVRRLSAGTASLGVLSVPVVGVIASMILLGERLTPADIVGFALIFAASACVLLSRQVPAPEEAAQAT